MAIRKQQEHRYRNHPPSTRGGCALLLVSAFLVTACDQPPKEAKKTRSRPAISSAAIVKAGEIYASRCTVCHGALGKSDGEQAKTLTPRPAKFSDPSWQDGITDFAIEEIIAKGGAAVGKSLLMPPNLDLSKETIQALRMKIRNFRSLSD